MERSSVYYFSEALELLRKLGGRTIVEIGSIRNIDWKQTDGHSTLAWGASGLATWSIDLDASATQLSAKLVRGRYPNVRCLTCEGIEFLKAFPHAIDLLYLDGPDPDIADGRRWAAHAFAAAIPKLSKNAVLLIDDTDFPNRGKGEFVIEPALAVGFKILKDGRQTLLVRGSR